LPNNYSRNHGFHGKRRNKGKLPIVPFLKTISPHCYVISKTIVRRIALVLQAIPIFSLKTNELNIDVLMKS
jgi:hypothetical protein